MAEHIYDDRKGLWVPPEHRDTRVFPPVLQTFEDAKPPVYIHGTTQNVNGLGDCYGHKPVTRPEGK